jgi:hypothetical protein
MVFANIPSEFIGKATVYDDYSRLHGRDGIVQIVRCDDDGTAAFDAIES